MKPWIVRSGLAALVLALLAIVALPTLDGPLNLPPGVTQEMLERAETGDAQARFEIALAYLDGGTVEPEREKALHWLTLAADRGHPRAQSALGHMWMSGGLVSSSEAREGWWVEDPVDDGEALPAPDDDANAEIGLEWLRKAAGLGEVDAMERLALALERGEAGEPDPASAVRWYRKPAQEGSLRAQVRLAGILDAGTAGERDAAEAATWYRLAAEQGHGPSQARLAEMYTRGDGVNPRYDEAARWARAAVEQDQADGCYALGVLYLKGLGVEQDFQRALHWYREAATRGHPAAQNMLGTVYLAGEGVPASAAEAERWWRMAAQQGYAPAQFNLGGMFGRELSRALEKDEAMSWLEAAARQGHRRAAAELAELNAPPVPEGDDALPMAADDDLEAGGAARVAPLLEGGAGLAASPPYDEVR
jgi:TPR repeat protein